MSHSLGYSGHPPCGIYLFTENFNEEYLPLERVIANVSIVDVSATVKLTQEFWSYSNDKVPSASYVFPVPARAAVCGFEMRSQDGKIIKAIAKEKQQARKEYEAAVKEGHMAGIIEHATDDIFRISLGTLPAKQLLTTTVTYVMDLMEADLSDQVRFHLPVSVGQRFGQPPEGVQRASALNPRRVDINVNVRMKDTIRSITSPSHTITHTSNEDTAAIQSVNFVSNEFLQHDFSLMIKADGLDTPRCFAETHPTGTTALQLTMVPKFNFPPIPVQEYIFIIDRSGSMMGDRIETAKNTLIMLLRSLPARGTSFNVFKFDNDCSSLWGESVVYSEESLKKATEYVERIYARGGTEIESALKKAFGSRNMSIPTACFVLTDGEAYNTASTFKAVSDAVGRSKLDAPLRVFTLGIGNSTSTEMCEGIARLGNGICLMAVESESIVGKTAKLLRASRTYPLSNVTIDWGAGFTASDDVTAQTDVFRQAPQRIPPVYASNRFVIFALVKHTDFVVPDRVVVKAQQNGQGEIYSFEVPVERLPVTDTKESHLIHTLAARRIIQELDDRDKTAQDADASAKEIIIHLGEQYQLASRYTSFVAVEKRKPAETDNAQEPTDVDDDFVIVEDQAWLNDDHVAKGGFSMAMAAAPPPTVLAMLPLPLTSAPAMSTLGMLSLPGGAVLPPPPSEPALPPPPVAPHSFQGEGTKRSKSKRKLASAAARKTAMPLLSRPTGMQAPGGSAFYGNIPNVVASSFTSVLPQPSSPPSISYKLPGIDGDVVDLVRLQSFNGSFTVSPELEAILGKGALAEGPQTGIDQTIWATVLAVAYLQKYLAQQPELLEGLLEKAKDFVSGTPGASFAELLEKAKLLIK